MTLLRRLVVCALIAVAWVACQVFCLTLRIAHEIENNA
ncbi:hypothetical protein AKJ09_00079 [Labilithrix luteola]|uniref:Uncharacterized protein n=1 Tax=Labilithrix luteola TaxID=1391654 RepID=A0A0K1PIR6_9BACT|nr:hypothetical protein AKJ09_00011 [Labilithrix luteola]AKU93415.1 hypothetical protein AKJ09_00079 [Labilithrix luteola]